MRRIGSIYFQGVYSDSTFLSVYALTVPLREMPSIFDPIVPRPSVHPPAAAFQQASSQSFSWGITPFCLFVVQHGRCGLFSRFLVETFIRVWALLGRVSAPLIAYHRAAGLFLGFLLCLIFFRLFLSSPFIMAAAHEKLSRFAAYGIFASCSAFSAP